MRRILPIACVAFAFTVGLNAQTGTGSSTQGTPSGKMHHETASKSGKTVTLTGCLREGDTAGTYQLTNVEMSGAKSTKGSHAHGSTATSGSASGTESSSGQAGMGSMGAITLVAGGNVDLKEHVGHKVQVTGTWANASGSGTPDAEGTSGTETPDQTGSQSEPQSTKPYGSKSSKMGSHDMSGKQLTVKSLKHISDTCQ